MGCRRPSPNGSSARSPASSTCGDGSAPVTASGSTSRPAPRRRAATDRVGTELDALFAVDPVAQRTTPLEIVRTAYREPTTVLRGAGVPEVVRDAFDERAWPDDVYGLVPRTFADLDDEALAPLHLAWGLAKAKVLREQRTRD